MVAVGVMIEGQEGLTWERWLRLARVAEELGFESLWRSDHYHSLTGSNDREALETWTSLTALATQTSRIRFGPLVCSVTFRAPANVARMAAAIDRLSGGRFELGLGAGWNSSEHLAFGLSFPPPRTRLEMLDEQAAICRLLWSGQSVDFRGKHYTIEGARCLPTPRQSTLPLVIGGTGDRLLRIVAARATEWNSHNRTPDGFRERREVLRQACGEVGRDPDEIRCSWMGGFIVGSSPSEVTERARGIQQVFPRLAEVEPDAMGSMLASNGWIVGTTDEAVEQMQALAGAGVQRFMLQHHLYDDVDVLALLAREIVPVL
jgi:F420-dependent oxidoreductase-like protein